MTKYQYTAINKQGKSLNGIIESDTPENARKKLSTLKLTIVDLNEIKLDTNNQQNYTKYKFEAINKESKTVKGTISSSSLISAFKKLVDEYQLEVQKIASLNASPEEFNESSKKIKHLYETNQKLSESISDDTSVTEHSKNLERIKFQQVIEELILLIRTILSKYSQKLKPESIEFLQKYELHLNKIKFSNNIDNISNSALKVLEQLKNSASFFNITEDINQEIDLQKNYYLLSKRIKKFKTKDNELQSSIKKIANLFGINSKANQDNNYSPAAIYLEILFKTKSDKIRKIASLEFFKSLFSDNPTTNTAKDPVYRRQNYALSKSEKNVISITFWLLITLISFYFLSNFLNQKLNRIELSPIFNVYNSILYIYFLVAIFLIHSSLKIKEYFSKNNNYTSKIIYPLFTIFYILILLNL